MASVGIWSMASHAPVSQVRLFSLTFNSVPCVYSYPCKQLQLSDSNSSKNRKPKFKCPQNQKREGQLCSFCLLVFRATTLMKRQAQKPAYPLAWTKTPLWPPLPSSVECGRDSSPPSSCPVGGGNSSPANEILFQVCNLHLGQTSPPQPPI